MDINQVCEYINTKTHHKVASISEIDYSEQGFLDENLRTSASNLYAIITTEGKFLLIETVHSMDDTSSWYSVRQFEKYDFKEIGRCYL